MVYLEQCAWEFLKRNNNYIKEYYSLGLADENIIKKDLLLASRAKQWGLYAYNDPASTTPPFWIITPTLEARVVTTNGTPFLTTIADKNIKISKLSLFDGSLILKLVQKNTCIQIRIRNGKTFSKDSGLSIQLPTNAYYEKQLSYAFMLSEMMNGSLPKENTFHHHLLH